MTPVHPESAHPDPGQPPPLPPSTDPVDAAPRESHSAKLSSQLEALLSLQNLGSLPRTGWILAGVPQPESVAAHTAGVAQLALTFAGAHGDRAPLDLGKVLAMAILHDAAEAWTGDWPKRASDALPAGVKHDMEAKLGRELLGPLGASVCAWFEEYGNQASPEARFVKACDRLQMGVRALGYARAGQRGLEEFMEGVESLDLREAPALEGFRAELMRLWKETTIDRP